MRYVRALAPSLLVQGPPHPVTLPGSLASARAEWSSSLQAPSRLTGATEQHQKQHATLN
jgi:hypothetical protein